VELRQLRYFVAAAEDGNVARAARRLGIAAPSLSQQLAALERSLGVVLFERPGRRGLHLTTAGRVLLTEAPALLAMATRTVALVQDAQRQGRRLQIRIAMGVLPTLRALYPALENHPGLEVNLISTYGTDAELAVLHGHADLAIVWIPTLDSPQLRSVELQRPHVSLVMSTSHPLAQHDRVPVSALRGHTVALFPRDVSPPMYDHFVQHLLDGDETPAVALSHARTSPQPLDDMVTRVRTGRAVAPMVDAFAPVQFPGLGSEVVARPLDPPLALPLSLVWSVSARRDATQFVEELRSW
jgi:DNA-binding transcriptional LysR family regulator